MQSFARGLQVIRSFSAQAPQQTLSEVAQHTGLTRAGARRTLLTVESLGYVRCQGCQFSLAPRILDLGFAHLSSLPLWTLAEPVMERPGDRRDEHQRAVNRTSPAHMVERLLPRLRAAAAEISGMLKHKA